VIPTSDPPAGAAADAASAAAGQQPSIARSPTQFERGANHAFRTLAQVCAWLTVLLVVYIVVRITAAAIPSMRQYGVAFLTGKTWDANTEQYGIRAEIWGTLYSSLLALLIGSVFGLAVALFLSERMLSSCVFWALKGLGVQFHPFWRRLPDSLERLLKNLIELLAAIPSVVYGLWGIYVLIPLIRPACNWCHHYLGWIPIFGSPLSGPGMLPAAIVLAIMILPTISAISRDALTAVPPKLREAAYGLGATRWEAILAVIMPTAITGIFGSIVLAFGRALGETMALAMLVGNANKIDWSLFSPANTLAALLANNFPEAAPKERGVLMYAALVLLGITLIVNILGTLILFRASRGLKEAR
jgi:phosphate transport system permease protein